MTQFTWHHSWHGMSQLTPLNDTVHDITVDKTTKNVMSWADYANTGSWHQSWHNSTSQLTWHDITVDKTQHYHSHDFTPQLRWTDNHNLHMTSQFIYMTFTCSTCATSRSAHQQSDSTYSLPTILSPNLHLFNMWSLHVCTSATRPTASKGPATARDEAKPSQSLVCEGSASISNNVMLSGNQGGNQ